MMRRRSASHPIHVADSPTTGDPVAGELVAGRRAGFSIPEVLIAALLLLIVALGLIPLFMTAMVNNSYGEESTRLTARGRAAVEEFLQLNFAHEDVDIPVGATELMVEQQWDAQNRTWVDGNNLVSAASSLRWSRQVRVQQFSINGARDIDSDGVIDIIDGLEDLAGRSGHPDPRDGRFDNPISGAVNDAQFVHLKTLEVVVAGPRLQLERTSLGGRVFTVNTLKIF